MLTPVEITWLIAAVARGDTAAFERLYATTCAKIYGVVLRILRRHDLAAAVMEETYLQIWNNGAEYDPAISNPVSWMVAIARRRAIDLARQPDSGPGENEPVLAEADSPGVVPRREMPDELKRLLTCIGRLEPERQRMLLLAYYGAFTRDHLATKIGVPPSVLKASLRRALFELEQCLTS
jgi:RNA polymerase sigma-70 factor (ECF subfamily)